MSFKNKLIKYKIKDISMGIYNSDKKDYEELLKEKMLEAKLLYNLSKENQNKIKELLYKKEKIKQKNGIFSTFQINKINKKIEKIRKLK